MQYKNKLIAFKSIFDMAVYGLADPNRKYHYILYQGIIHFPNRNRIA